MPSPISVRWTDHALAKAEILGIGRDDIEQALLRGHESRRRNVGSASWRVTTGGLVVLYDHPDHDDPTAARVVTIWRRR